MSPEKSPYPSFALVVTGLITLLACVMLLSLVVGQGSLGHEDLKYVLLQLRAGRMAAALLAGSALAIAGVLVQGLFQNPLASPSVIGTTGGASLGGQVAMLGFSAFAEVAARAHIVPEMVLPIGCILGALLGLMLLLLLTRIDADRVLLVLAGFLLSSLFVSLSGFITSVAQERWELARAIVSFALGDLSGAGARHIALALPLVLAGGLGALLWARPLDLMLSGPEEAATLGVDVARLRRWTILWTSILTAAAVSLGGNVGFVGLVVPHALRPWVGTLHGRLIVASAIGGALFLVACDVICRVLPTRGELPLGVVTGMIGAPTFLVLLLRYRGGYAND